MTLGDQYEFILTDPLGETRTVTPINDTLAFAIEFEQDLGVYSENLATGLNFVDNDQEVYSWIYRWERENRRNACAWFYIQIRPKCLGNGPETEITFADFWDYQTPATFGGIAPGQIIHPDDEPTAIYVHKTADSTTSYAAELVQFDQGGTVFDFGSQTWTLTGPIQDLGDHVKMPITPGTQIADINTRFQFTMPPAGEAESWKGRFTVRDCDYDIDRCHITVQAENMTGACLTDNWKDTINLVESPISEIPQDPNIAIVLGEQCAVQVQGEEDDYDTEEAILERLATLTDCLTGNPAVYAPQVSTFDWYPDGDNPFSGSGNPEWIIAVQWQTEQTSSPTQPTSDNGKPWIETSPGSGIWQRLPITVCTTQQILYPPSDGGPDSRIRYSCQVQRYRSPHDQINRTLQSVLEYHFAAICGESTFRSHFFGVNPGGDYAPPSNGAYQYANENTQTLGMICLNDTVWIEPETGEVEPDTQFTFAVEDWSFEDLIEDLTNIFNLETFYHEETDTWYLEHVTFRPTLGPPSAGLNLIAPQNEDRIRGTWKYSYDKTDVPRRETFEWAIETDGEGGNFDGYPIEYSGPCVEKRAGDSGRAIRIFMTNYSDVIAAYYEAKIERTRQNNIGNPDTRPYWEYNRYYEDNRFVLVNLQKQYATASCLRDPATGAYNATLGWPCLHSNLWVYERPLWTGSMNDIPTTFESTVPERVQDPIEIQLCCQDYYFRFSPWDPIRSQLGWGILDSATYEVPAQKLTINIRHD